MEASGAERTRRAARRPSRATLRRRRVLAGALVLAGGAGGWLLLSGGEDGGGGVAAPPGRGVSEQSAAIVADLTLEERVDQVLLLGFDGADPGPIAEELRRRRLGGVLVGPANWAGAAAGSELVGELHAAGTAGGRIPPLVATAQEGGRYRALADLPPEQTELEVGDSGSPELAEEWARTTGAALRKAGFELNLAPVADVATLDSALADRAFSDDPAVAAQMTAAAVRGCGAAGIACAVRHFPGLGAASQDTNAGPATVGLDPGTLATRDLEPFRAAFAEGAPAVVLSLAFYTAFDPVTPGALSPPVATGLLRDELGFEGLAITDDLGAGAVRNGRSVPKAAVLALAAGSDLLQIGSPEDQRGVREEVLAALADGRLSAERLDEAAGRVIELKRRLGLLDAIR